MAMQIHSYRRLQPNLLRRLRALRNTRSSPPVGARTAATGENRSSHPWNDVTDSDGRSIPAMAALQVGPYPAWSVAKPCARRVQAECPQLARVFFRIAGLPGSSLPGIAPSTRSLANSYKFIPCLGRRMTTMLRYVTSATSLTPNPHHLRRGTTTQSTQDRPAASQRRGTMTLRFSASWLIANGSCRPLRVHRPSVYQSWRRQFPRNRTNLDELLRDPMRRAGCTPALEAVHTPESSRPVVARMPGLWWSRGWRRARAALRVLMTRPRRLLTSWWLSS